MGRLSNAALAGANRRVIWGARDRQRPLLTFSPLPTTTPDETPEPLMFPAIKLLLNPAGAAGLEPTTPGFGEDARAVDRAALRAFKLFPVR
jgi:hypothetical protein